MQRNIIDQNCVENIFNVIYFCDKYINTQLLDAMKETVSYAVFRV